MDIQMSKIGIKERKLFFFLWKITLFKMFSGCSLLLLKQARINV